MSHVQFHMRRGVLGGDWGLVAALAWLVAPSLSFGQTADPCANNACCVNPATCVITDKQTLAGLTIDATVPTGFRLGTYVSGNGATGVAPAGFPAIQRGLSFTGTSISTADALNSLDHFWLQTTSVPKVVDFGSPVNNAMVFVAVDHGPFPEEGIESTVWGGNSPDVSTFPSGWALGALTTIWKRGWEDPVQCQDNADDFVGQYSFPGQGFRYVAVYSNFSISILDDPTHTSWQTSGEDVAGVPGWQSFDDEIDAIGTHDGTALCGGAGDE